MELNRIIFPAPRASYSPDTFSNELVWIPQTKKLPAIPCLYLPCPRGSSKVLIYFHGNAEDIGLTYELMDHLRSTLLVHILAVEYPGYGVYPGSSTATRVIEDAETVFEFLTEKAQVKPKNVLVFGRSIGSGPATWLAAHKTVGALLLMSAYTSIRAVVKNLAGSLLQYFVKERFRNIDLMPKVTCPTFIVHGQRDKLIPFMNSQELHDACEGPSSFLLPKEMDHNEFDFFDDLSLPFASFIMQCGIQVHPDPGEPAHIRFPSSVFEH